MGRAISRFSDKDLSFTCVSKARWNLGDRILNGVKPFSSQEAMNEAESNRFKTLRATGDLPGVRPVSRIYIHCGPCACAVHTALRLTQGNEISEYFDFVIRIDERLPTSCRRSSTAISVLTAIHDSIDQHILMHRQATLKAVDYIDCPELEKRIYNLEQERFEQFEPANLLQKIVLDCNDLKSNLSIGAIIIIAETDHCQLSLENRPFYSGAKKPRETDIFSFVSSWTGTEHIWHRQYEGSYTRSKMAIETMKARSPLPTGLIPPPISSVIAMEPPFRRSQRPRSETAAESDSQAM